MDNTCCTVKKGTAEVLLEHLNRIRPSIQFTLELEKDGSLPFLDTHLRRKVDGTLDVTVYRKPTHTDRYLNFRSHHPIHVRRGLVRCLYDRARKVTTSPDSLRREEKHLESVLKWNGYPVPFIRNSSIPQSRSPAVGSQREQPEERPPLVMLYIYHMSQE